VAVVELVVWIVIVDDADCPAESVKLEGLNDTVGGDERVFGDTW
jgi:hypothetical protein